MSTAKLGASLLVILALVLGATALARAETVECTPITTLPATITVQGIYCFTADLNTSAMSGNAIDIQTNNVVVDLNGFKLSGLGAGLGTTAVGIHALDRLNITIKNGTIRGFFKGIFLEGPGLSQGHVVEGVHADQNTFVGIQAEGTGTIVRNNQAATTGGTTIGGGNADATGILASGPGPRVLDNDVTDTTKQGTGTAVGIQFETGTAGGFAANNRITGADKGIEFVAGATGKCRDNLIFSVTTPFTGCTDAGSNQAPAITSASATTFAPGKAGQTFTVMTTGSPTNTISRTGTLPSGVTFTDNGNNTATIAGTPAAGTQGSSPYSWVIKAANGVPPDAVQSPFLFNVVCPTITVSGTIPALTFNTAMATATFTQTGGNGTITWSSSGLPAGTSINPANGDVTGTPTVTGTFNVTITATDAGACTGSKNLSVTVNGPPAITSASTTTFAPGKAGQTFNVTTTGFPTNTISRTGTLPSGVTFTDNGNNTATIAGTPAAGTQGSSPYSWVITASNGVPPDAVQNPFLFNVVCPTITVSGTIPALTFNTAMATATFTQTGGNGTITWSSSGLPTGTSINPANGQVTGTPTVTGTFNVTITATDAGTCTGSKNQSVTVAPVAVGDSYSGLVDNTQFVITGGTTASPATPFVGAAGRLITNDLPSGNVTATAGTFATSGGGSVTIAADGTFIYTPKANSGVAAITSDSFTYTVFSNTGGGAAVTSAPGTVNLTLAGRVWYVLNNGAAGNGQSQSSFNTLSAAVTASTTNDTIFVYQGSGTTTNLATASILKAGQRLIGQGVALVVNSNTLVAAGGFPLIGNTVTLASSVTVAGLDMSTGASNGIVGTSVTGLSVTVRDLTATTGTAVNIGGSGNSGTFSFRKISAIGGGNGIVLQNTTGSFTVTGDGTNTALGGNASGGTIANMTGGNGATSGIGVYLNSAQNVTLRRMTINGTNQNFGIRGVSVTNFTMEYSTVSGVNGTSTPDREGAVIFDNLFGTNAITSSVISGAIEDNVRVENTTGTLTAFNLTNSTIQNNSTVSGNIGFRFATATPGVSMTGTVSGCTFQGNRTIAIQADASNGTVTFTAANNTIIAGTGGNNQGNQGIEVDVANNGVMNFSVSDNKVGTDGVTNQPLLNTGINIFNGTLATSGTPASITGTVTNNTVYNAGAGMSGFGIRLFHQGYGTMNANVSNNTVNNVGLDYGILAEVSSNSGTADATGSSSIGMTNNTSNVLSGALDAIRLQARGRSTMCARINGNASTTTGSGFFGLEIRQAPQTVPSPGGTTYQATFNLEGLTNGLQTNHTTIVNYLASQNPAVTDGVDEIHSTGITGVAANSCSSIP